MYHPSFSTTKSGVPILSNADIEYISEQVLADFCPVALEHPMPIDVDRFLTNYLGLDQDYKYLSHCGLFLGMTVFQDCTIPVFDPCHWCAESITVKAGTVIIDNCLLEENQEHRYRFTAAHEGSHSLLHSAYYLQVGQNNADTLAGPGIHCLRNAVSPNRGRTPRSDSEWLEWQANRLASALLMPRAVTYALAKRAESKTRACNAGLMAVSSAFNVSTHAAYYRLKQIGYPVDGI